MKQKIVYFFLVFLAISCQKKEQKTLNSLDSEVLSLVQPEGDCPPGTHPVIVIDFDGINFKRPKTGCTRGFSLCLKNAKKKIECVANNPISNYNSTTNITQVWAKVVNSQVEIHFPKILLTTSGYIASDFQNFTLDENYTLYTNSTGSITLLTGQYPITVTSNELVVSVNAQ